jgi:hypothetical protein
MFIDSLISNEPSHSTWKYDMTQPDALRYAHIVTLLPVAATDVLIRPRKTALQLPDADRHDREYQVPKISSQQEHVSR